MRKLFLFLVTALALATPPVQPTVYKQTPTRPLNLYVMSPPAPSGKARPVIVFFFGGGWVGGSTEQFLQQAQHFIDRGLVSILVDYRVRSRDQSTPFDSVRDARSALRWVRSHAAELHIDPAKIIASGGSAGGHVAGATAILADINDHADDLKVSPVPNALVLFNPVLDTTETGYGAKLIGKDAIQLSLTHHVKPGLPPIIIFHGTADRTVPFANVTEFARRVKEAGGDCRVVPFEGAQHGFFNSPKFRKTASPEDYGKIIAEVDRFLTGLGFEPKP